MKRIGDARIVLLGEATHGTAEFYDMRALISQSYRSLLIDQDLGLGMMLWLCHFFPDEDWAIHQEKQSIILLGQLWIDPPGYFCRQSGWVKMKFAFTNYGISLGLQSLDHWPNRVQQLNTFFDNYVSNDECDTNAIIHVMACTSHYPGLFLKPSI